MEMPFFGSSVARRGMTSLASGEVCAAQVSHGAHPECAMRCLSLSLNGPLLSEDGRLGVIANAEITRI